MSSNNQGCSDDIASISMSFRRWSFSGNEDKDDHHDTLSGSKYVYFWITIIYFR